VHEVRFPTSAIGAVVNAAWDLHYLEDVLSPAEALELLETSSSSKQERAAALCRTRYPAYSTTPEWLGYCDDRLGPLCEEASTDGFDQIKTEGGEQPR
jgi:L-fuconate dehydratase